MGLTVTILAYHEAENLKWLLPDLKKVIDPLGIDRVEYLIVDSAEPTDDTPEVCRAFGARYVNQEEPGYGGAYRTAICHAREELFLILDADGSQDYTQIPKMYEAMTADTDVVIGSRYIPGGSTDDAKSSQVMSKFLNFCFRIGIGVNVHDFSDSLRLCRTADLQQLHLTSENFDISEELILKLKLMKGGDITIKEVPVSFKKRIMGESKRSLMKFIVCFGRMLVYCFVLRFIAGKRYDPQRHDARAQQITDLLLYGVIGVLTTAINLLAYFLLDGVMHYLAANVIAWVVAVLFAFITNKTIVFNNWNWKRQALRREFASFVGSRVATGVLDMLMLWLMVDVMAIQGPLPKILDAVVVIVLNYVLGKTVFRDKKGAVG